jgi:ABC-type transporter Mla maintaining outer membrane lipid asymmetry ATPase subunit MlaF
MSEELLAADAVQGSGFGPLTFRLGAGEGLIVRSAHNETLDELLDTLFGLTPPAGGTARLFGSELADLSEVRWLAQLDGVGYATDHAGLLSNLKVWENLVLPAGARADRGQAAATAELEQRILDAFAAAELDEEWVLRAMPEMPDRLNDFERVVCALVRCHVCGFRLLVCDRLFEALDGRRAAKLGRLLDWLGASRPESGLLVFDHASDEAERRFGLSAWKPIEMLCLESGPWHDS